MDLIGKQQKYDNGLSDLAFLAHLEKRLKNGVMAVTDTNVYRLQRLAKTNEEFELADYSAVLTHSSSGNRERLLELIQTAKGLVNV